jgi:regulator of RNase E activity RraA
MKTICTLPTRWLQTVFGSGRFKTVALAIVAAAILSAAAAHVLYSDVPKTAAEFNADPAMMLEAYRHVEAASVSDAIEQILHEKRFMSHRMQAIFPTKFAGRALTVKLAKMENNAPDALSGMLQAIDSGGVGSVYVMQVEDGADIAGMGGLMGSAMFARGFSGAVIDGGIRDIPQLKRIGFPAGDIIVADQDGVVVVPQEHAAEILIRAQQLDNTEHSMYPFIEKFHSITEAVRQFGRI